jgi:hypothetical protein
MPNPGVKPKAPTRERLPPEKVAFIPSRSRSEADDIMERVGFNKSLHVGRPHPPGRLENSEHAANSRKNEYSVCLPLCLAGFGVILGGVPFGPGAKMSHS